MRQNLESSHGLVFSQRVLLALVGSGMSRDDAYRLVQRNAMRAWDEQRSFRELLAADADVTERLDAISSSGPSTSTMRCATQTRSSDACTNSTRSGRFRPVSETAYTLRAARSASCFSWTSSGCFLWRAIGCRRSTSSIQPRSQTRDACSQDSPRFWFARTKEIVPNHLIGVRSDGRRPSAADSRCSPWSASCVAMSPARRGRTTSQREPPPGHELPPGLEESRSCQAPSSRLPPRQRKATTRTSTASALRSSSERSSCLRSSATRSSSTRSALSTRRSAESSSPTPSSSSVSIATARSCSATRFSAGLLALLARSRLRPRAGAASFDKQFVRDYAQSIGWDKTPPAPALPEDVVAGTRARYIEAFELLTGVAFDAYLADPGAVQL